MKYTFKDICTKIGSGATPTGGKEAYKGGDYALVRSQNVLDYTFTTSGLAYINETQAKKLEGVKVESGDVLLNITGDSVARACIIPDEILPARVNQHVAIIRANNQYALNEYLLYFLQYNKQYLLSISQGGGTRSAITKKMIEDIEIDLPSIEDQLAIVNIINSISKKIEVNQQINDNLEQQAQALYKSWFVDFEPFKDGEFIESELGKIPEGWQCIPFSMFVTESKTKTGKIGIKEYSVTNNGIFPRDAKYNKSLSQSSTKNKLILYGDLVFGMSRDILNWGVMQEEQGGVSSAYTVYNINSGIVNSTYLELFIKSRIHLFSDLIRPAAREGQGIDKSVLQTKVLLYPPQEVLDTFWPLYDSVTNQIQTTTTEINCLGDVRDTLLPKLMSGELKINEIDC